MAALSNLFQTLGVVPHNEALYVTALTHSSYKTKDENAEDYERLEFLGDAVLNMVITTTIFNAYPEKRQGELTNMRKNFVRSHSVASLGRKLNLQKYIRTGKSITATDVAQNDKYFEDTFEALIGALYLDQGFPFTEAFILSLVDEAIKAYDFNTVFDFISTLQEFIQADRRGLPQYETVPSGLAKEKAFIATVSYDGIVLGKGYGANNKEAEQNAAKDALAKVAR